MVLIVNIHYIIAIAIVILDKWIESLGPHLHCLPARSFGTSCRAGVSGDGSSQSCACVLVSGSHCGVRSGPRPLSEASRGLWVEGEPLSRPCRLEREEL